MKALHEQIKLVAEARHMRDEAQANLTEAVTQWWTVVGERQFRLPLIELTDACDAAEERLKEMTLDAYRATSDKHPAPGVDVRIVRTLFYLAQPALEWAKAHGLALQLDTKAFEKIAKVTPLPFVTITEVPQATIAQDLSEFVDVQP